MMNVNVCVCVHLLQCLVVCVFVSIYFPKQCLHVRVLVLGKCMCAREGQCVCVCFVCVHCLWLHLIVEV